jgi:hypothetical protein
MKRCTARKKTRRQSVAKLVSTMVERGAVEDEISARLGIDKNQLRAKYITAIKRGRGKYLADSSQRHGMNREEKHVANAVLLAFADGDEWLDEGRCLLWPGLADGGAVSAADAYAAWLADGGRLACAPPGRQFSRERLRELFAVKRAAEELLKARQ